MEGKDPMGAEMTTRMPEEADAASLVSLGEIKELAEVGRPTVSNWRRRFAKDIVRSGGRQ
jgi:hypothetical protein